MLENVTLALHKIDGLTGMSIADYKGFGRSRVAQRMKNVLKTVLTFCRVLK